MLMSTLNNNKILFSATINVQACRENFYYLKKKLDILKEIKEGDKIGKVSCEQVDDEENEENEEKCKIEYLIEGEYCLYKSGSFQKWSRWWYNENHEKTFGYLDKDFSLFARYLDRLKSFSLIDGKLLYKNITLEIINFINEIIKGLYHLKETYNSEKKLKSKIESIIMVLLDFKNENTN